MHVGIVCWCGCVSCRIDYEQFAAALGKISERKYQEDARSALRQLMTKCVLPLYERLREKPTFVTDVVQVGREEEAQQFVKEFLQPEVVRDRGTLILATHPACPVPVSMRASGHASLCLSLGTHAHRSSSSTPTASRSRACSRGMP